ncbi:DNA-binding transcriptional regulator [Rhizobium sp. AG855]|uniref:helix-turn-helix domain-containing protein n=1 Tax=Rhizobium sp. AG855 TaxID=2183898 RepID=UPI000E74208A|nr:DNA-binding transcriptional regulator [Rhizobium sp. AG855]RKE85596.1 putative transcriptional regulator [Rhizobium sp. AG855]
MTHDTQFKSDAFEAIHSAVADMVRAGTVDKQTVRYFDETCLSTPQPMSPAAIKALRESHQMSQPVFARHLNTSTSTVQKWETGAKRPSGPALKLLAVVEKHGIGVLG